ncbi:MAG: hypothetical protein QW757_04230 [Candidatus Woesearchaeota archaeon]
MDIDELLAYQNMLQKSLRKEVQIDRKIELLTIINQLTFGPKNIVQKELILVEAQNRGFSEREVNNYINELIKENIIYEPMPGYIKKR